MYLIRTIFKNQNRQIMHPILILRYANMRDCMEIKFHFLVLILLRFALRDNYIIDHHRLEYIYGTPLFYSSSISVSWPS